MRTDPRFQAALAQQTLSLIVHAPSKVGKTTLAATAPKPLLLIDAEGGSKFLPYRKTYWEPLTGPPPMPDGTWDVCVVHVRQYQTMALVYQWLAAGQHGFASVSLDSITEVQRRCKESLVGTEQMKMQDWGDLLTKMEVLVRGFRDLTLHPTVPLSVAVFVAETREKNGKWRPYLQGQMEVSLPYLVDVIGYMYAADVPDPVDPLATRSERFLLATANPIYEAGERVQGALPPIIQSPNVEQMLDQVYQARQPNQ